MGRTRLVAGIALPVAIVLGLLGAWAFNPDSGSVLHNEVLWRIFGIMGEGGLFLLGISVVLLALLTTLRVTLSTARSIHRSHSRS